jgi:hypothetical protein
MIKNRLQSRTKSLERTLISLRPFFSILRASREHSPILRRSPDCPTARPQRNIAPIAQGAGGSAAEQRRTAGPAEREHREWHAAHGRRLRYPPRWRSRSSDRPRSLAPLTPPSVARDPSILIPSGRVREGAPWFSCVGLPLRTESTATYPSSSLKSGREIAWERMLRIPLEGDIVLVFGWLH